MKNRTRSLTVGVTLALLALLGLVASVQVLADGDTRLATQSEKDFMRSVLNVLAKATPPGPGGWDLTDKTEVVAEERVTAGAEKYPLRLDYRIAWQDSKRMMEANAKLAQEVQNLAKKPGGFTEKAVQELNERLEPHDVNVKITLTANSLSEGIYEEISPAPSIAGAQVFRSVSKYIKDSGWREGTTYVFLGKNWKLSRDAGTYVNATAIRGIPHTAVQTIVVKVQGDPNRIQQILNKIDWEALKRLIKN